MRELPEGWSRDVILALFPSSCCSQDPHHCDCGGTGAFVPFYQKPPRISWRGKSIPGGPLQSQWPSEKGVTKALETDLEEQRGNKTPGGAPRLGWGCGSAVIQEFPPAVTVLPWGGDTAVSSGPGSPRGEQARDRNGLKEP